IFTRSPVRRLDKADAGWILRTPSATVEARRVVLAANGGNGLLHPALARMTLPLSVYEYATAPLAEADRLRYFDGAVPFTDRNTYVFTARLDGAGRLISAVPGRFPEWTDKALAREAERRLRAVYPEIPV